MNNPLPTSNELTTVESKLIMIKERREAATQAKKEVDKLVSLHVDGNDIDSIPVSVGCFGRIVGSCHKMGIFSNNGRTKLSTVEISNLGSATSSTAAAAAGAVGKAVGKSSLHSRIFGNQKGVSQQREKIEEAMQAVSVRLESLRDRAKIQRERAVSLSQKGRKEEAMRELKKAKATDKQTLMAQQALDTLERQSDLLSESVLQREMATALASTNQTVKSKTKGLLPATEKAVDESQELRDAADDVAAAFDGLQPTYDFENDELLEELAQLVEEAHSDESAVAAPVAAPAVASLPAVILQDVSLSDFPVAPTKQPKVESNMGAEAAAM